MSFRKKGVRVTQELLHDILREVNEKFFDSPAPKYLKQHLRRCNPVFHIVNRPHWGIAGQAWLISTKAKKDIAKRQLKLRRATHPTITLDGDVYFMVIQINKGAYKFMTRRGLKYLVAHELGHILDTVVHCEVDGVSSFSTSEDHNIYWHRIVKWMGGTGQELVSPEEIWC